MEGQHFHQYSYKRHVDHLLHDLEDPKRRKIHETWFRDDNAAAWLEARQYEVAEVFSSHAHDSWLTIGDGMYGLDSIRLRARGLCNVLPSDIAGSLLRRSRELGLIKNCLIANAEELSLKDDSFDYVFCKDSFHHFPRPMVALYEMIRIARKAVILCEPSDPWLSPAKRTCFLLRRLLGKAEHFDSRRFETVGNYIYTLSVREMEKLALGIGLPMIAYKGKSHAPVAGYEFASISLRDKVYRKMRIRMAISGILAALFVNIPDQFHMILFIDIPNVTIMEKLRARKFKLIPLPRNPHTSRSHPLT